jgi:hypothetical protein
LHSSDWLDSVLLNTKLLAHLMQNWTEELDAQQQQELQQQLFATEPCQVPALLCLAMESLNSTAELLIAAATGRGTAAMEEGISRFTVQAQQALQQQLAGQQLVMLLQAAISTARPAVVELLMNQPAAQLSADAMVQLLQHAMCDADNRCGRLLVNCFAANLISSADVAGLLEQVLQLTDMPLDFSGEEDRINIHFTKLMGLEGAQGIDTAAVVKLLTAVIAAQLPYTVAEICGLPAAAGVALGDLQQLLQQAVTADRTADYYDLEKDVYASYAGCVQRLGSLPAAREVPLQQLHCWLQRASDKEDGEMVAALLMGLQEIAFGLSSEDVLQLLQAAVVLKNEIAATSAVTQLGGILASSIDVGDGIQLQAEDLEQLLTTAMQL